MRDLITYEEFAGRYTQDVLPSLSEDKNPQGHVLQAISDATGIIVSHLSWLIDKEVNDITENIPIQFESVLKTICCDIAFLRINDKVASDEDSREKYKNAVNMLEKIDKEYKGGLSGPNLQSSFIVDEQADKDLADKRFFKKGELI
ncbi:phage protein Gp36 family protein [uncultured Brachyspira sp.]|uniref:phage protein Gp36 family protein n=1 Tax=uncultured Brachyspira sp. TaxID=221953 RepID=UPI002583D0A8|nr:phage protein Gp36 family protein [uncultured Brachyspira sp.]